MADASETKLDDAKAEAAAEKAYAAATEQVELTPAEPKMAKPKTAKPAKTEAAAPVATVAAPLPAAKTPVVKQIATQTGTAAKPKAAKKPAKPAVKKAAPKKPAPKKIAKPAARFAVKLPTLSKLKESIMAKTTTEDFTVKIKDAVADMQERTKAAYEKSTALLGEVNELSKGNVEALVESGKILAAGLQELGKDYVAEGKSAFETMTADVKELAAVKTPADFFKLQGEILRRNFDAVVASGSKHSEAVVKLANDAFAPISSRVSIAVEKVKQAA